MAWTRRWCACWRRDSTSSTTEEVQPVGEGIDLSTAKYGAGGLRPAWEPTLEAPFSPLWRYPMSQVCDTLERLAAESNGSPFDGVIIEYPHPLTGGPTMPPIACYNQMLSP